MFQADFFSSTEIITGARRQHEEQGTSRRRICLKEDKNRAENRCAKYSSREIKEGTTGQVTHGNLLDVIAEKYFDQGQCRQKRRVNIRHVEGVL